MVHENAAQSESVDEGRKSTAETTAPFPVVGCLVNIVTRSGTRANPSNEEGGIPRVDILAPSAGVGRCVNAVTHSGTRVNPSNEGTESAALVRIGAPNDQHLRRIDLLAYMTERRAAFANEGECISSIESFGHAAGSTLLLFR